MMRSASNSGRLILLRHFLIVVLIALIIPIVIEVLGSGQLNISRAIFGFYKISSINLSDIALFMIQLLLISWGLWKFGGDAGESIIAQKNPNALRTSFVAVFKLWLLFLLTSLLFDGLPSHGWAYAFGLIMLSIAAIHSLIAGFFISRSLKQRVQNPPSLEN